LKKYSDRLSQRGAEQEQEPGAGEGAGAGFTSQSGKPQVGVGGSSRSCKIRKVVGTASKV